MSKAAELAALIGSQTALSNRNLIINGAMQVDQRNSGSSVSAPHNTYTLDRLNTYQSGGGAYSVQQQTSVTPVGFGFAAKINVDTIDSSIAAGDYYMLTYNFEGHDTAQLEFGTSGAKTVTLSFYVRSSLTGTFSGAINNDASDRAYTFEYTIDSADTWERKTITVAGDQSGTWPGAVNTRSIKIRWALALGSTYSNTAGSWASGDYYGTSNQVNLMATLNNTFYITGVQLELGEQATPFEHRSYADELRRCQRYFTYICSYSDNARVIGPAHYKSSTQVRVFAETPVVMRARGSLKEQTSGGQTYRYNHTGGNENNDGSTAPTFDNDDQPQMTLVVGGYSGLSSTDIGVVKVEGSGKWLALDAEL